MNIKLNVKLSILMSRFMRKMLALDRHDKAYHGVTLTQHYTIEILYRREVLTMNELSRELDLAISTLTRIIDVLVRDGIVSRQSSAQDRRKVCVTLTKKGRNLAERLKSHTEQFWTKIFDAIPYEKKKEIGNNIKTLLEALDKAGETHS